MGECINYMRKDFWELYTCVIVVLMIVLGIPTCIRTMEFLLGYKFCSTFDPDENCQVGGFTVCECFTNCCTRKKKGLEDEEHEMELDDHIEDLYEEKTMVFKDANSMRSQMSEYDRKNPSKKKHSKCALCCMAVFCRRTRNT